MVTSDTLPDWLARLYPFAPKSFQTPGGARMSYLDEGPRTDEAVLLLHGNPTWSFFYRDPVRDLSSRIRCIAPDHVGMGLSDKPAGYDYRLSRRIGDVEALVGSLGLRKVHLVVHDWGGAIGFGLAARQPGLIGRIAILNTAAFPATRVPARIRLCRIPWIGAGIVRGLNGFSAGAVRMAACRPLSPEVARGYLFPYDSWAHRIAVHRFIRDIPLEPGHPSLAAVADMARALPQFESRAGLILWGGRDFCFDDTYLKRWREYYPRADCTRYPEAGHYLLEDAGEDARSRLRNYLLAG